MSRRISSNNPKLFNAILGIVFTAHFTPLIIWGLVKADIINISSEIFTIIVVFFSVLIAIEVIIYFLNRYHEPSSPFSICNSVKLDSLVKDLKKIKYKNLEGYQGDITELLNKPSIILLEKLNSEFLKDPIVYKKQLYSFKEFKNAIIQSRGIVPHDRSLVEINEIKRIKTSDRDILESIV